MEWGLVLAFVAAALAVVLPGMGFLEGCGCLAVRPLPAFPPRIPK